MTILSKSAFAASRGWSKAYVSKLVKQERLVLTESGQVDVEASELLLANTTDPSKAGVAARHHQDRLDRDVRSELSPLIETPATPPPTQQATQPDYQKARARREHYLAELAESESRKVNGELVELAAVDRAAFSAARMLRDLLLGMPPQIASELVAMTDPWEIERHLTAAIRRTLDDAERLAASDLTQALSTTS